MMTMTMISYLSCSPGQEWVSKWQKQKLASSWELEAKGNPKARLPFNTPDVSSKPRPQLTWQYPNLCASTRAAAARPGSTQTIMVWPHKDLAAVWSDGSLSPPGLAIGPMSNIAYVSPSASLLAPWPTSFQENEGLANSQWLSLVWIRSPGNCDGWRLSAWLPLTFWALLPSAHPGCHHSLEHPDRQGNRGRRDVYVISCASARPLVKGCWNVHTGRKSIFHQNWSVQ